MTRLSPILKAFGSLQNYIQNPGGELGKSGWATYGLTEAVTFTDTGDLVGLAAHGLSTGTPLSFSVITSTTGISINTTYYAIYVSSSTFTVASSLALAQAGTFLALTTNGTGTLLKSIPMTGTGGSPSSTLTKNTSTPLRGDADLLWTHSANNRMGEGFSYSFTIDLADKGKVLQGTFDYKITSAASTYADDDLQIWIYDVTNLRMIQPTPYKIKNHTLAGDKMPFEFQSSSDSVSYRLIVHTASINATAYTLTFDNFSIGPNAKLYGSPVTDWVAYTPTASWTANSAATVGKYRRVGDSIECDVTTTAGGAVDNTGYTVTIPSGLTIDTAKLSSTAKNNQFGTGVFLDAGVSGYLGFVTYESTTAVRMYLDKSDATYGSQLNASATIPFTWASTDTVQLKFSVPITGFSSSVIMSSDAATRVTAFYADASTTALTANVTNIVFANLRLDTHGGYSAGVYTVKVPGLYSIQGSGYSSSGTPTIYCYVNGSIAAQGSPLQAAGASGTQVNFIRTMVVGDTISMRLDQTVTMGGGANLDRFSAYLISGPAQIASSETVAMLYAGTPTGTVSGAWNLVTYPTKRKDSHGIYASGIATIPVSGTYLITASTNLNGTWAANQSAQTSIWIDDAETYTAIQWAPGATGQMNPMVSVSSVPLLAGQTVRIKNYFSGTGGSHGGGSSVWFSITRTGNY